MAGSKILIDAGPLVAFADRNDPAHKACAETFRSLRAPGYTCWPVITEAIYLLRRLSVAVDGLLSNVEKGDYVLLPLRHDDISGIRGVLATYSDQQIDLADACLLHLANREGIKQVFTLDRRHFGVFRTNAGRALSLLPE